MEEARSGFVVVDCESAPTLPSGMDTKLLAAAAPDAADAATVLTVLPPPTHPPLPLSALVSPFGRLLEELLVSDVSRLSMERGRWKTGSGAITTSGSFGQIPVSMYRFGTLTEAKPAMCYNINK